MTVFYLTLLITHQQERNNSYVSQLQPVGRKSNSFVLPPGWIAQNNTTQNQAHVFSDKEGQDSRVWCLKEFCFKAVHSGAAGCKRLQKIIYPGKHGTWHTRSGGAPFSLRHLNTKPVIAGPFIRDAAQVYLQFMSSCHGHDGCQLQIRLPARQWSRHGSAARTIRGVAGESQFSSVLYNECPSYIPESSNRKWHVWTTIPRDF